MFIGFIHQRAVCQNRNSARKRAGKEALDLDKLSEALGHLIGKNLQSIGLPLDLESLVRGIKSSCEGAASPLSEDECVQALAALQEASLSLAADQNLVEANEFLKVNEAEENIVCLEEGKVQYKILKRGKGDEVQPYNSPLLHYKGSYLNGQVFGASSGDEVVCLDESISGFAAGIVGMREGEVRKIYIHPDLGYGRHGLSVPNALLIFEVELLKADASAEAQAAASAEDFPSVDEKLMR